MIKRTKIILDGEVEKELHSEEPSISVGDIIHLKEHPGVLYYVKDRKIECHEEGNEKIIDVVFFIEQDEE